ncbi:hypothetical protein LCGC14_1806770 [marine sediment metagenome]|uniref:Metallo-beta-lactamase domain-containing protein n=1 Tax=marine sediment metagenome TaxID=412755 RepID=A0A0F9GN38_9ZZZZ
MTELLFHGAARRTTGSMHVLKHDGMMVSLDCGLYQGRRDESRELNQVFPVAPGELDSVVLSHAHIDHTGRLPGLVKGGFDGPVYATPATKDLCGIMLPDSAHIQEEDARFWNERRAGDGERIEPLYTAEDVDKTLPLIKPVFLDTEFELGPDCRGKFIEAGHILGSAMVLLEINRNGSSKRILFSGDAGRFELPILRDPSVPLPECDYLITECTYADRRHDNPTDMKERLCRIISETVAVGGKVIIPAFSVGRTQTIIYFIIQLFMEGRLKELPVYVDSPLSTRATEVFAKHPEVYDAEALKAWGREGDLFGRDGPVRYITAVADSKALNHRDEPCVILSASGMCEVGRILHHLKNNIEDENNTVIIVGFMAQHTLGRRIVERREELKIFGRMYRMLARVEVLNGFSAHADADEFRRLYAPIAGKIKRAFVVHGEQKQPVAMKAMLEELGCRDVVVPSQGDSFEI